MSNINFNSPLDDGDVTDRTVLSFVSPFDEPTIRSGVNPGWIGLLQEFAENMNAAGVPYRVEQFKEKFGTLRLYISEPETGWTETQRKFAFKQAEIAEMKSASVCEKCGQPGHARSGSWAKTLCDSCAAK